MNLFDLDRKDDSYSLMEQIDKEKKKILRDEIEDRVNEENAKGAKENAEADSLKGKHKFF
ncbi:hypothetical protein [Pseudobutyrivibrio sp. AR14]|uniref:hypothetical protein n=1 Tax=Pseudobutyrivibrio sp. AR14 TaxID=1520804 RepID=UPI000B7DC2E7|nr:hypothetical protein [Pseudobutyrivibrio sp. AR14]